MSKQLQYPAEVIESVPARSANDWLDRRRPQGLQQNEDSLPKLYTSGARTMARDRWERIVSSTIIPAPAEQIWRALTDPQKLGQWLISCQGSLEHVGQDCILDFEDGDFFLTRPRVVNAPYELGVGLALAWHWPGLDG